MESNQNDGQTAHSTSPKGPSAHEDLTIAEEIETMRVAGEHRPGEECFLDSHGEKHWVSTAQVQRFVRRFGAEHSSNYLTAHGTSWEADFFNDSNN